MNGVKFISLFFTYLAALTLGQAAQQVPMSIETLTTKADAVVHGKVKGITCKRDSTGRIFSVINLNIIENIKGQIKSKKFELVHGGGILGSKRTGSIVDPRFKVGEEVVVFVVYNSRGEAVPLGQNQGRFEVFRNPGNTTAMVRNPFHGSPKTNDPRIVFKRAIGRSQLTLTELKRRIRRSNK